MVCRVYKRMSEWKTYKVRNDLSESKDFETVHSQLCDNVDN